MLPYHFALFVAFSMLFEKQLKFLTQACLVLYFISRINAKLKNLLDVIRTIIPAKAITNLASG